MRLKTEEGALIAEAQPNTPAANAGLKSGDVIVAVNGERIANPRELSRKVATLGPAKKADITYNRDGVEKTVNVTLASQPTERQASLGREPGREQGRAPREREDGREPGSRLQPESRGGVAGGERYGMTLAPASAVAGGGSEGVVVAEVEPDGTAARQGIRSGDIILEAAGAKVTTPEEVSRAIADARRAGSRAVMLRIKSGEGTRFVALVTRPS